MTTLHAQPYDIAANGFFFKSLEECQAKATKAQNYAGDPVEEFEIQFIDGEQIDAELAKVIGLFQSNIGEYLNAVETWDDHDKTRVILAVGECGHQFDLASDNPDDLGVDIYHVESLRDLAVEFVEEGLFGDIPDHMAHYLDYDAIAYDLSMDYREATIAGERIVYRCG